MAQLQVFLDTMSRRACGL